MVLFRPLRRILRSRSAEPSGWLGPGQAATHIQLDVRRSTELLDVTFRPFTCVFADQTARLDIRFCRF
jgi:hypothetical protein